MGECECVWSKISLAGAGDGFGGRIEALAEGQYFLLLQQPQRVFLSRGVTVCQVGSRARSGPRCA